MVGEGRGMKGKGRPCNLSTLKLGLGGISTPSFKVVAKKKAEPTTEEWRVGWVGVGNVRVERWNR